MLKIFAAALLLSSQAWAEGPLALTGRFGLGFDSITGASAGTGLVPGLAQPNALSVRYWINEKFSWEGDLGATVNSQPGTPPNGGTTTTAAWGLGTMFKYNQARPHELFLVQWLGGLSFAQLGTRSEASATATPTPATGQMTSTFSLYVGTGFEAFIPVWRSLSVEGSIRLRVSTIQTKTEGSTQAGASSSFFGFEGSGFTPLNAALHYYF